ncbi:MAG: hypothetical protein ACJAYU_001182 [Bradymonadia bacterium]|jgi:uncharacterized protein (DUF58 family)
MLPRELIKKVKRIELVTRRLVNPQLAGAYHSVFKGRGMDFDEVLPYHSGDDVRFIDWNVSARTGDLHIKRFVEERELTVQIVVDTSSSMQFGTALESKRAVAAQIAAVLAVLAIKNNDRVGLVLFDEEVDLYIPPKKGKKHVLNLVTQILDHQPRGATTDIGAAMQYLSRVTRRRSVVFVISDFFGDSWKDAFNIASRRHDVIPVVIRDPREESLAPLPVEQPWWKRLLFGGGMVQVEDLETGATSALDLGSARQIEVFSGDVEASRRELAQIFNRLRLDTIELSAAAASESDYVKPLAAFFRRRSRRH